MTLATVWKPSCCYATIATSISPPERLTDLQIPHAESSTVDFIRTAHTDQNESSNQDIVTLRLDQRPLRHRRNVWGSGKG
jgi:hypothetical protein